MQAQRYFLLNDILFDDNANVRHPRAGGDPASRKLYRPRLAGPLPSQG